jgi:predicted metalloprotease with PDZ domain
MSLDVDARDIAHGIQSGHLVVPVKPGPLVIAYPKWIPGEHTPSGPLTQVVNVHFSTPGHTLDWRRDAHDPFLFRLTIPPGERQLEISFDYLSPPKAFASGYGNTPNMTSHLLIIEFNHLLMYPLDRPMSDLRLKARVRLPQGWKFDGAMRPTQADGDWWSVPESSLSTLVDSPLIAGEYFRTIAITQGAAATRLSLVAENADELQISGAAIEGIR